MLKKLISLTLSLFLVVGLIACGSGSATIRVEGNDDGSSNVQVVSNVSLKSQIQNCTPVVDYAGNTSVEQMDYITFGLDEHSEPIEWIVLEKESNKALLLSKYLLTTHSYNDENVDITWENCICRKWLNSEFMNLIFSKKEQGSILTTEVVNNNAKYGTAGGNNTKDKLFLLSIDEFNKYFNEGDQSIARSKNGSSGWWWLRSPGSGQYDAAGVNDHGNLREGGLGVNYEVGIRPALWVKY